MGVPRLFTLLCVASTVLCNTPGTDRPDITMLYKGNQKVCVAGSNTQGYGLAFMTKNIQDYEYVYDFKYRDENGDAIDTKNNCDFENRAGDRCIYDWNSHRLVLQSSDTYFLPIAPITDERWNNFYVHRTRSVKTIYEHDYTKSYKITNNFFISFSIRSKQDAQILLCSTQYPKSQSCYWILIDAFDNKNKDITAIRKCARGVPNTYPKGDPECSERRNQTTIKLLSESKWTHFILSRVTGKLIRLWSWDINTGARDLLTYKDDDNKPLSLSYMYVRSFDTIADWKIHNYQYLITQTPTSSAFPLGPALNVASSSICVSFYVIMCSKCKMIIKLETDDGIEVAQSTIIEGNPDEKFITWRNVKIQNTFSVSYVNRNILIYPTLSITAPDYTNPFWAIDDFRICSNNEIRVASINNNTELLCQSLKYPDWTFNTNKQLSSNEPPNCPDGRYIGLHCNISCSVSGYFECSNNYKLCLATREENGKGACTCMAGNKWTNNNDCTENCYYGTRYGYNCNKECGKCKYRNCNQRTGECVDGCEYGYLPPYCQNTFPRLLFPPIVTKELYTSVNVQFNNITITGSTDMVANATIYLECKTESDSWYNCSSPISYNNLKNEISILNLKKETSYSIRVIIYTSNGYSYRNNDLPFVNATTICKKNWEIQITKNSRNATINFIYSEDNNCGLQNYLVTLYQTNTFVQQYYATENIIFLKLKPYTDYEIVLTNVRYADYKVTRNFKTEQDAPGQIKEIKYISSTSDQIILSWEEPKERNGIIQNYNVTYELIQRIDCTETPQPHKFSFEVAPSGISYVVIKNLQPYSTYYITVFAQTILPGKEVGLNAVTHMINDISGDELPDSISTDATSESVTVRWNTINCNKQNGPLYFNIVFKCVSDDWCKEINDTVLDNINSKNSEIITSKLTPFTNYEVELRAKREENGKLANFTRNTQLFTPTAKPPAVRNFTAYSKGTTSISLRWLDPYPPHGLLENYYIKYCYNTYGYSCADVKPKTTQLSSCDLWNESFKCYVLPSLFSDYYYTIYIQAKNQDTGYGDDTIIRVRTVEEKPSAPLNLTHNWKNNEINLYWNHPDIPNGRIRKFEIVLEQNETDLTNQDENRTYFHTYDVSEEMRSYTVKIPKLYRYSSSYVVTVYAVNINKGDNATLIIDTPPETPELDGKVTVDGEKITNTTVTLSIPGAKKNTRSHTSFLYVIVSTPTKSISKRETMKPSVKQEILKRTESNNNSWIAIENDLNEEEITVELGDGQKKFSTNLQETIYNKPLEPDSEYIVTVLVMNQYKNEISSSHYISNIKTAANAISSGLYALLLLLLLPVVGYFIYRYVYKKGPNRISRMMIPGLRSVRSENSQTMSKTISEDQHEPDVIPLTEAANEPDRTKPKKPAAPKPGTNPKPSENTATEVNATGTNFFHSRIVLLENLEDYLKEALENGELNEQHALFPRGQTKPWDYGMLKPNKYKNRYNNLIAYDKNRVKLEKINSDQYSDYINASYIHGYRQDKAYIATQGPKLATVNDFWRMIWQEKTQYIVMLANVVEGGKKKCEKYWPDIDSSREYGNVDVYFEKSEVYADYEYRTFEVTCKGKKRIVTQLHFTSWPDHGVPLYPQSLVPFLKKMLTIPQSTAPVVVHCSAGVGRTGTIILSDICLRMAAREKAVDVLRYLHEIREQRANMVDNIDQYKLVHMVLLECLLAPDTNIPCNAELSNSIQKLVEEGGLQIQLNYLQQSAWQDKALNFSSSKQQNPINESKNRFNDIVPSENQIYISRYPVDDENSDYINAIPADGFRFKEQFIVTQLPMSNTVKDFWRMVAEKTVKIVVSLNDIPLDDQTCCVFWPGENEEMKPVPNINLKHHKLQSHEYYDVHSVVLDIKSTEESWMVQIVQFKNWKHGCKLPPREEHLVMLWEDTETLSRGNYPMIVTCYDGATASGLFVAMSFVIEKIKLEQQCDPCLAVRVARRNRKQFVSNKVQFEFLYRSAVIYLSMFETYSNFQPVVNKQNDN